MGLDRIVIIKTVQQALEIIEINTVSMFHCTKTYDQNRK